MYPRSICLLVVSVRELSRRQLGLYRAIPRLKLSVPLARPHSTRHQVSTVFYSGARTLTFVQERPIGLGIKNNLGSLRRLDFLLSFSFLFHLPLSCLSATHFCFVFTHAQLILDGLSSREVSH